LMSTWLTTPGSSHRAQPTATEGLLRTDHRTGGLQRTHPVFTQRERGSVATSLPLIWSLPLRYSNGTAPPAGSMVSVEGSNAWDLHPMVPAWSLGAGPSAGSLLPLRSQFSVFSLLNHLVDHL
jgi:hypothetical protein